jgi:hypothetical protein
MKSKISTTTVNLLLLTCVAFAEAQTPRPSPTPMSLGLFGSKPIQLSVDKAGIKRVEHGFVCDLDSEVSKVHYSEWGETEKDARIIVKKKCSNSSGLLLCKEDKITCKADNK